jgi:hypothetical protein
LVAALAANERTAPLLVVDPQLVDEEQIAAEFGRRHLALAVIVATAALRAAGVPIVGPNPAAVMGVALNAVRVVLPTRPRPPAFAAAQLARRRAEYVLPRWTRGLVVVTGQRWALIEGSSLPEPAVEPGNGLVTVVPGGIVVRTGVDDGTVSVDVQVMAGPPADIDANDWDEVVDVSHSAVDGAASIVAGGCTAPGLDGLTFP